MIEGKKFMKILLLCFFCLNMLWADEIQFFQDMYNVHLQNVQISDSDCRPAISRIRKLFYDGTTWNLLIPEAEKYQRPTDTLSLDFKKKYQNGIAIQGQTEDFAHVLAVWDGYMYSTDRSSPEMCSWLGDLGSALATAYKQHLTLQQAFGQYASDPDLRANLAGYHLHKISQPYIHETYKFPIVDLVTQHYQIWHYMPERQTLLLQYFASVQLVWEEQHFTTQSRLNFIKQYTPGLKMAALAYYYAGSTQEQRIIFSDADAQIILDLYLSRLEMFFLQENL